MNTDTIHIFIPIEKTFRNANGIDRNSSVMLFFLCVRFLSYAKQKKVHFLARFQIEISVFCQCSLKFKY